MKDKVCKFREAFSEVIHTSKDVPEDLKAFPAGACEVASIMLMTYLNSSDYSEITYVSGSRIQPNGDQMEYHSFLKYRDLFIDITGSQFDDCEDELIILVSDHPLHKSFDLEDRGSTDIYEYSNDLVNYVPIYEKVTSLINT
ncbi:hypothetical protein VIBNISFn27_220162 [Vibrio nigripulchritudo SFn27]|uniref:Uncharacterized protein n=1 Tax=Vibrio nigripulchritudo TaxID=28173 RepID=U4KGH4_9VIBR|nr:hypothetical protein [Vibrio nigripulchritudo]CCN80782.1 hypothetical protein VIBNIBLFn1_1130002 [Vibrio nigripulchritudo BLFn1]CCN88103.1 hypothetical protein VIBNISFn27_220162 [Vibrio nigripulchritudo SFn27]CCN96956.1 hypothetical protein VIBNIENn2_850161 [Vibrio nigripulchritudo ENn2]CCO43389.1 hypothetical protein VIBNISFn135_960002 [Vibrio nigripulchritudo SFn135]CCO51704.1 hypothetical protein VIBNIWn13_130162 [Vibrio nigripulchritudo Wn13]